MCQNCPSGGDGGEDDVPCLKCCEEGHFGKDCSLPEKWFKCNQEGHESESELPDTCF